MDRRIKLGARVRVTNGVIGTVEEVLVDPNRHQPEYLVIRRGRIPLHRRRIAVPVRLVREVSRGEVFLATTRQALDVFPDYESPRQIEETSVPVPAGYLRPISIQTPLTISLYTPLAGHGVVRLYGANHAGALIGVERGMKVLDTADVLLGSVHGLILDGEHKQATHIVVRLMAPLVSPYWAVPIDLVADVGMGAVKLRISAGCAHGPDVEELRRDAIW